MSGGRVVVAGVGVCVGSLLVWWAWRRRAYPETPNKWEEVGEVSELVIYPLKSGRGVKVTEAQATRYGLAVDLLEDRSFMATLNGDVLRGKFEPKMFDLTLTLDGSMVTLQGKEEEEEEEVQFDLQDVIRAGKVIEVKLAFDTRKGYDCGEETSAWLTKVIKPKEGQVRLVYNGDLIQNQKACRQSQSVELGGHEGDRYFFPHFKEKDRVAYAQYSAYMLASETSLTDLNSRLIMMSVTLDWFRPNIVVKGAAKAYDEDDWAFVRIGDVVLRRLKPCTKYVDPVTGVRSADNDDDNILIKTLKSTRVQKVRKELEYYFQRYPVFGSHLGIDVCGKVRVGDTVEVARASTNPRWHL